MKKYNEVSHKKSIERYHNSKKYQEILEMNQLYGIDYESLPANEKISYIHRYHNSKKKGIVNHKVVSVCIIDKEVNVYDITVQDNHNFALTAGVIVHNSKDVADAFAGAMWNASQNADQFEFDYGETIDTVVSVNGNDNSDVQLKQLSVDFEAEMQKALDPIKSTVEENRKQELKQRSMDFGTGPAQQVSFIGDGIIVW